jgi:hypothetical protein
LRKIDIHSCILIQSKRERKGLARKRKNRTYYKKHLLKIKLSNFLKEKERKSAYSIKSEIHTYFIEKKFVAKIKKQDDNVVEIPKLFSLIENYYESIIVIKKITMLMYSNYDHSITIDFDKCEKVDVPSLFVLQVIRAEFWEHISYLNRRFSFANFKPKSSVRKSKIDKVNSYLLVCKILSETNLKCDMLPISTIGFIKGNKAQKHYSENKKGSAATEIVKYVDDCMLNHEYNLSDIGKNYLGGIVSEILNNAEDHSPFKSWYVTANHFSDLKIEDNKNLVSEVNLAFLNFGYSFFEGFEQTKEENQEIYLQMNDLFNQNTNFGADKKFTKEKLFTLYALQDGFSRLKYESESRGTGSMKFINSFLGIGDYEDTEKGYCPQLSLFSGSTLLKCDNTYKPFSLDNVYYLSLNKERDLAVLPSDTHLQTLTDYFPGSLLSIKIYFNKEHLTKKIENGTREEQNKD